MNDIKLSGSIQEIGKEQVISEKFKLVKVILNDMDKDRPQLIELTFSNGRIDNLAAFKIGDVVDVRAKVLGRKVEHEGKTCYYNTLSVYNINLS